MPAGSLLFHINTGHNIATSNPVIVFLKLTGVGIQVTYRNHLEYKKLPYNQIL